MGLKRLMSRLSPKKKADGINDETSLATTQDSTGPDGLQYHTDNEASTSLNGADLGGLPDPNDSLAGTPYRRLRFLRDEGMGQAVVLALDTRTNTNVVIKLLERGPNVSPKVEPEVVNHAKCRGHPNIVQLLDLFVTSRHLAIVMEFVDGGPLRSVIEQRGRMPEADARWVLRQVARALQQYHAVGMTKRDMRLENVLLCGDQARPLVKLCDFAYSKSEQVNSDPKTALGTLVYTAPEEIKQTKTNDRAADIWGCGVLLYVMLCGTYPFGQLADVYDQKQVQDMLMRIMSVQYVLPDHLSDGARDLLSHVLVGKVEQRYSLEQLCQHPWMMQDLPAGFWEMDVRESAAAGCSMAEDKLRTVCREAQQTLVSRASDDIDALADEIMDMEECEATFDDLDLEIVR